MPERQKCISPFLQAGELCSEPSEHKISWDLQNGETLLMALLLALWNWFIPHCS